MSIEIVKEYLKKYNKDKEIITFDVSTATVKLAAQALNVKEGQIAKTLAFKKDDGCMLIVTAGDVKIDNSKFKNEFGFKARMMSAEETAKETNHAVGGVCPFGVKEDVSIYLDKSLLEYETVYPACGSSSSAILLTPKELSEIIKYDKWIDVCKLKETEYEQV